MRRGLVHLLAWTLATGAAATMTWWGVHTVMAGTAYDPPRALPITVADAAGRKSPAPEPEPRPRATTASPEPTRPTPAPSPTPTASPTSASTPGATPSKAPSTVKAYDTDGGRAVFDLGTDYATLVSATPGAGWSMQVWKTETWIRVEFGAGADRVTVFCTWHDGPPHVQVLTY
jgi:pyruvate/2-oxoglutarate dehydrogenase complex dihydrolipoamide acyltransferase (E2) component